jgi:phage baseplate assembly protein W
MVSRLDRITETGKQETRYSDFLTDLTPHPNTKDLVKNTNVDAVKRSIRNLIQTNRYERLMRPNLGSGVRKILFEPITPASTDMLKQYVTETIGNFEPRAKVLNVDVFTDTNNLAYTINIYFYVINIADPVSMTVTLYRVR